MVSTKVFFKHNYVLIGILLLSAVLRFYHLDYQSLWLDEIHTANESNPLFSLSETFKSLYESDPHPPLYFLLVKALFSIFGSSSFVLRFFSAVLGVAGVWALYLLGKELYSKKVGLYAAALLSVNFFHIYYSQDARPYPLLCLTTTISFYYLIKFIRTASLKSAVLYGVFTGVMLGTHLFALFVLLSQCVILLYFVCRPYNGIVTWKKFFLYCLLAGVIVGVMYIPCFKTLLIASQRTSMWIPEPAANVFIELLKEFFGNSGALFYLVLLALVFFFARLIGVSKGSIGNGISDRFNFAALILLLWIITVFVTTLIRSYVSLPIIVSRYFICVLPAFILIIVIGLSVIKNRFLEFILIFILVLYSLINVISEKKYYKVKTKTEFREATKFIIQNNKDNTPVVTSLGWYMPFFLKNDKVNYEVIDNSLDVYIKAIMADSTKIKAFWYIDGHVRPYAPSKEVNQFLEDKFCIENNFEGYDIWTRHYVPKKDCKNIDISKFGALQLSNGDSIKANIDLFENTSKTIKIVGWAYFPNQDAYTSKTSLVLINGSNVEKLPSLRTDRKDVTEYFKLNHNVDSSGFSCEYDISHLKSGEYKLGIYSIDNITKKEGLVITDKIVVKQ